MGLMSSLQLWALTSEALLAVTHIKVLLCVGKPLSKQTLSSKRYSYFVWDLISPWLGLALALAPAMAATAQQSIMQAACSSSHGAATLQVCAVDEPGMWGAALTCLKALPAAAAGQVVATALLDAGAAGVASITANPLLAMLVLLLLGHAALHVYYIITWNQHHARRVVEMSACKDVSQRLASFGRLEALWFHTGTCYDIGSHLLLGAVLAQSVMSGA